MKSYVSIVAIGVATIALAGCTAKINPDDLARIEAAAGRSEAAANRAQAAAEQATASSQQAADASEKAERAARKAEAIFGSSMRK
jgi:hypothetical protein